MLNSTTRSVDRSRLPNGTTLHRKSRGSPAFKYSLFFGHSPNHGAREQNLMVV